VRGNYTRSSRLKPYYNALIPVIQALNLSAFSVMTMALVLAPILGMGMGMMVPERGALLGEVVWVKVIEKRN
jgi:hypothetical protein